MIWPLHVIAAFVILESAPPSGRTELKCLAVQRESITAGDLAEANSAFASLDPHLALASAPMPGARRLFSAGEFARLARQYHLSLGPVRETCFEWSMQVPAQAAMAVEMARVLGLDPGAIKVVEQSQFPAPPGALIFRRDNLKPIPSPAGALWMWRGFVQYGVDRKFLVWAKLRIEAPAERVVAITALLPGELIAAGQLKTVSTDDGFAGGIYASSLNEVVGHIPTTRIEALAAVRLADLKTPPEITAGTLVEVEVRNGAMRLYAVGRAERSGQLGETIPLTNPGSSAHFVARVEGKNRVSVTVQAR